MGHRLRTIAGARGSTPAESAPGEMSPAVHHRPATYERGFWAGQHYLMPSHCGKEWQSCLRATISDRELNATYSDSQFLVWATRAADKNGGLGRCWFGYWRCGGKRNVPASAPAPGTAEAPARVGWQGPPSSRDSGETDCDSAAHRLVMRAAHRNYETDGAAVYRSPRYAASATHPPPTAPSGSGRTSAGTSPPPCRRSPHP